MRRCSILLCVTGLVVGGCYSPALKASDKSSPSGLPSKNVAVIPPPHLEDVTTRAGIRWTHNPGRGGKKYLPETVGGGGGFIDYDQDGNLDIVLINGGPMPGYTGRTPLHALYRNNGDGTFTETTRQAGLTTKEYGIGAAVADYDNDGWPDLYITAADRSRLLRNVQGKFVDVTAAAGVAVIGFTTAATFLDYDRDGDLDLFVGRYVDWTVKTDLPCGPADARQYCAPHQYAGAPPVLFRNRGNGTFEDVSATTGVLGNSTKTLAIAPFDYNRDGWLDLFLANDTEPDVLLMNQQGKTFADEALIRGIALGSDSTPTGSMGVDATTPFNDARTAVAIGAFAGQQLSLFVDNGDHLNVLFENRKEEARVAFPTGAMTTFGLVFADVNGDGRSDVLMLNGHIDDDQALSAGGQRVTYRQLPQLFLNQGDGTFVDRAKEAGIQTPLIGRGLAMGDYDSDGHPDFLAFENGGPVRLWRNHAPATSWLGVTLLGHRSPKDGTGAMVTVEGDGWQQTRCATTTRSYLSVCDPRVLFSLPGKPRRLIVRWPSGTTTEINDPAKDRYLRVEEAH